MTDREFRHLLHRLPWRMRKRVNDYAMRGIAAPGPVSAWLTTRLAQLLLGATLKGRWWRIPITPVAVALTSGLFPAAALTLMYGPLVWYRSKAPMLRRAVSLNAPRASVPWD